MKGSSEPAAQKKRFQVKVYGYFAIMETQFSFLDAVIK